MKPTDEHFMRQAIEQAWLARRHGDVPFGAVVVRDGQAVIATPNREIIDIDITAHAETKAISLASRILQRRDLSDCTLYASNEPCLMCGTAVLYACIPRVVYALSRDDLPHLFRPRAIRFEHLAQDTTRPPEIVTGILRAEALKLYDGITDPFRPIPEFHRPHAAPPLYESDTSV
jgi:tRNA(Arg) A34 adenosine deaminase TadA